MSYRVSVRALCEFTAKVGDLDLRFTPSPTALEGIEVTVRSVPAAEVRQETQDSGADLGLVIPAGFTELLTGTDSEQVRNARHDASRAVVLVRASSPRHREGGASLRPPDAGGRAAE